MNEQEKSLIECTPFFGKPREIAGRKAKGANAAQAMPARPPDTLHPRFKAKKGKIS